MSVTPVGAPPRSRFPAIRLLGNGRNVQLEEDVRHAGRRRWVARRGLISDGASIPRLLWPLIGGPFEGRHRRGALLHDAAYKACSHERSRWCAFRSRRRAIVDRMLLEVAVDDGAAPCIALLIYYGVRIGGWVAWHRHSQRKAR